MIIEQEKLVEISKVERRNATMCFGCFDLLHVGHIKLLKKLKKEDSLLIIGIVNDTAVRELKDEKRPIISAEERAEMVDSIKYVDYVFVQKRKSVTDLKKTYNFGDDERERVVWENCIYLLSLVAPGFISFSSDFNLTPAISKLCNDENIQIIKSSYYRQQSTSKILSKIIKCYG